jgi:hypothetical protein
VKSELLCQLLADVLSRPLGIDQDCFEGVIKLVDALRLPPTQALPQRRLGLHIHNEG